MPSFDPLVFALNMIVIVFAIGIHEFCHAKFADLAGDPTPRLYGRVTLNPIAHLDPMGTIMIIFTSIAGFGIGWGKPVLVDPTRMRNPRWDHFVSVAAGPLSNFLQAAIYAFVLRGMVLMGQVQGRFLGDFLDQGPLVMFLFFGVMINLGLFFFNLIPIGPLDGHWMLGTFMNERARLAWYSFNRGPGAIIFLVIVLLPAFTGFSVIGQFLSPLVFGTMRFLLGMP